MVCLIKGLQLTTTGEDYFVRIVISIVKALLSKK